MEKKQQNLLTKSIAITSFAFALSACGGGGDGDENIVDTPTTPTTTTPTNPISPEVPTEVTLPVINEETGFTNENVSKGVWYSSRIETDIEDGVSTEAFVQVLLTFNQDNTGTTFFDFNGIGFSRANYSWSTLNRNLEVTFGNESIFFEDGMEVTEIIDQETDFSRISLDGIDGNQVNLNIIEINQNGDRIPEADDSFSIQRILPFSVSDLEGKTLRIEQSNHPSGCTATDIEIVNSVGILTEICPTGVTSNLEMVTLSEVNGLDNLIQFDFVDTTSFFQLAIISGDLTTSARVIRLNYENGLYQGINSENANFVTNN